LKKKGRKGTNKTQRGPDRPGLFSALFTKNQNLAQQGTRELPAAIQLEDQILMESLEKNADRVLSVCFHTILHSEIGEGKHKEAGMC